MQSKKTKLQVSILFIFIGIMLVSCSLERKIAKSFVTENKIKSVLLFFPSEISKSNLKTELAITNDSLFNLNLDSIVEVNDLFLRQIDDSLFLAKCKKSMIEEFKAYGVKVYGVENIDEIIASKDTLYVMNLAQMQIEEYIHTEKVEDFIGTSYYSHSFSLNAINLNSWFELSHSKITPEVYPVLYSSYFIYDDLEGWFAQYNFNAPVKLRYKIDSLQMKDIYNLAELAGKKYAINFYDYLLNIHVQDNLPKDKSPAYYFHYNRKNKKLQTFYYNGFTEMNPENN